LFIFKEPTVRVVHREGHTGAEVVDFPVSGDQALKHPDWVGGFRSLPVAAAAHKEKSPDWNYEFE
jgi:hypothetical protein